MRQIDCLVQNVTIDGEIKSIIIDAKHHNIKVNIKQVEAFISMLKDTGQNMGIIVSEKGFSKSAIQRAHYGEDNIEVDILSMEELKLFQSTCAIPYSDHYGVVISAPFGWIIDGKQTGIAPATLYQRGYDLKNAIENREWMYLNIVEKNDITPTIDTLVEFQNHNLLKKFPTASLKVDHCDNITIRYADIKEYPNWI